MKHAPDYKISRMDPVRREEISKFTLGNMAILKDPEALKKVEKLFTSLNIVDISSIFFSDNKQLRKNAEIIKKEFPEEIENIEEVCSDICKHNFDFLGTGKIHFGEKINWHYDYNACYEWPKDINFLKMERGAFDILVGKYRDSEIKFPWDVSNLMWLPSLVSAFFLTDDSKYCDAVIDDLNNWFDNNPPTYGVNWFCPMNIAMRAINIIIALTALHPYLPDELIKKSLYQLMMHGIVISSYLEIEKEAKRNNHYLSNLAGLYYLGTFFQSTKLGKDWLDFAEKELELESQYQFYPDGTTFEDSTSYHRLSMEMLIICAIQGEKSERPFTKDFYSILRKGVNFTCDISPAHNTIPQIGDNDNGRMIQFCGFGKNETTDHRHILALGGEFLNDDKLKTAGKGMEVEAIWYLGHFSPPKDSRKSRYCFSYPDGGYYGLKDKDTSLLIRNGKISPYCKGGHAHEDQLSFTFSHNGVDILVDPGSFRYSSDQEARNNFRSVGYHNTIQVNNSDMHYYDRDTFEGLWWMHDQANAVTERFEQNDESLYFLGKIDSFLKSEECWVKREIQMDYIKNSIKVIDNVTPLASSTKDDDIAFSRFLFSPDLEVKRIAYRKIQLLAGGKPVVELESLDQHTAFLLRQLWFSPEYGRKKKAWQLQICWSPKIENSIHTEIKY